MSIFLDNLFNLHNEEEDLRSKSVTLIISQENLLHQLEMIEGAMDIIIHLGKEHPNKKRGRTSYSKTRYSVV